MANGKSQLGFSIVVASNDQTVLEQNLLRSPDLSGIDLQVLTGYSSAPLALNHGIERALEDVVICIHQDVYLPKGWLADLERRIAAIEKIDSSWGVLGVYGVDRKGHRHGHLYCVGNNKILGSAFDGGKPVQTLDEVVLIIRKRTGLRFDTTAPGFHLYGTDIAMRGNKRGCKAYAVAAFCIHNTSTYDFLPGSFWKAYFHTRKIWWQDLPITTPCVRIERSLLPVLEDCTRRWLSRLRGSRTLHKRVSDPVKLWKDLQCTAVQPC